MIDVLSSRCCADRWLLLQVLLTWGSGVHLCLGMNLAQMEIKVVLALLARGYEWQGLKHYTLGSVPQPHTSNGDPLFRVRRKGDAAKAC